MSRHNANGTAEEAAAASPLARHPSSLPSASSLPLQPVIPAQHQHLAPAEQPARRPLHLLQRVLWRHGRPGDSSSLARGMRHLARDAGGGRLPSVHRPTSPPRTPSLAIRSSCLPGLNLLFGVRLFSCRAVRCCSFLLYFVLFCFFTPLIMLRAPCPLAFCYFCRVSSSFFSQTVTFFRLLSPFSTSSLHPFCSLFSCFRLFPRIGSPNIFIKITNSSFPSRFCGWSCAYMWVSGWCLLAITSIVFGVRLPRACLLAVSLVGCFCLFLLFFSLCVPCSVQLRSPWCFDHPSASFTSLSLCGLLLFCFSCCGVPLVCFAQSSAFRSPVDFPPAVLRCWTSPAFSGYGFIYI